MQLHVAANLLEQIFHSIVDFAVIATDTNGHIMAWNPGAEKILGWTAVEMLGQPAARFFTPADNAIRRPVVEMEEALLMGRSRDERWHLRKNGELFWAMGELMPLKDASGQVTGFIKVMTDRTDQKLAATEMVRQQTRLEAEVATRTQERDRIWAISRDLLVTLTANGHFSTLNPAFSTELGYEENALVGARFDVLVHPEDLPAAQAAFEQTVGGQPISNFDCRIRAQDGTYRWYNWSSSEENGLIYAYGRDISVRKELERRHAEALNRDAERRLADAIVRQGQAERDRLKTLFEQAPGFKVVLRGPQHVFELTNEACRQLLGRQELIGKTAREALPELEGQGFFAILDEVFISGNAFTAHATPILLQRTPGQPPEELFIDLLLQPVREADGTVSGIFVDGNDVTERKRAHDAVRQLNDTLEQRVAERTAERNRLWLYSPDLIGFFNEEGVLLALNPAFRTVFGFELEEMVGKSFREFVHPEDIPHSAETIAESVESARVQHVVNRWRHKDGSYRWISWVVNNDKEALFSMGRDITEEKAQAEALRHAEQALRQAQKMEAVGQLTGGLAHDFNNMLAGITASLEILQIRLNQGRTHDVSRYIESALDVADRAAALTHRLLAFSRRQTLDPKPTEVNQLVASMEDLLRRTLGPGVSLATALDGNLWTVLCDTSQLENALLNLAINSRDAMPGGGRLTIETANVTLDEQYTSTISDLEPGEFVRISVSDTGAGMTAEVLQRAVDPFFTTKPTGQGTGLGLSMIYGFIAQSKGHMRIYSQPGFGTSVHMYLPRYIGRVQSDTAAERYSDVPRTERQVTVLLVEDEESLRKLGAEMLVELGYTVIEASDGREALDLLRSRGHVDLLITDVGLPNGMNGRQLADAGRELDPELRVLFITGFAETAVVRNGMLEPGMQVMTKPFSVVAFASRVRGLVEGAI